MYGLMMARYYKYPESKERGIQHLPTLVFFASEQVCAKSNASVDSSLNSKSHYSIKKSAIILGLGTESVIAVKCDDKLVMMSYISNVVLFIVEEKWTQWI